jgi:hypothetical protein
MSGKVWWFLIILVLVATPAMAEQKLFLTCTNGRDPETNAPVGMPNFFPIVVDLEARTLAFGDHRPEPVKHLDGQTIEAMIINTRTDLDITLWTNLTIDRVAGRLRAFSWMDNCAGNQQGMPRGMCTVLNALYDCSSTPPKPKF